MPPAEAVSGPPSSGNDPASSGISLRRFAYSQIEALLNSGKLRPGQLISQRELVELTGATLGSIREAIPRFEAEGLLKTVPKKGLMVPSLDIVFVQEAYQVRRMIECAAVPYMVSKLDDGTIAEMISLNNALQNELREQERPVSPALIDRIQQEDWKMHTKFVSVMSNSLLDNIYRVNTIKIRMAVQSRLQVTGENAERILTEHQDILSALATRDLEATRNALERHLNQSMTVALGGTVTPNR
jgi:DNA-binding GntR family transcriptional regulator